MLYPVQVAPTGRAFRDESIPERVVPLTRPPSPIGQTERQ
jgi:hypothetical protein